MSKIAIIGAGASGLMAAIISARNGNTVHIYEQNDKPAKKILASGNGRCNIINTSFNQNDYFSKDPSFVNYALKAFNFKNFEAFALSIGLLLDVKEDGRCYPLSNEAKSVALALESAAISYGAKIYTQHTITDLSKKGNTFFLQTAMNTSMAYDKVLIATGSEAAPQLGGNCDGYEFARSFGHTIEQTYPSLVQLHLNSAHHQKLSGTKHLAQVSLHVNNQIKECILGDILFTKYGISGFAILDISQKASLFLMKKSKVDILLNLLPQFTHTQLLEKLILLSKNVEKYSILALLSGIISTKLVKCILKDLYIDESTLVKDINQKQFSKIADTLLNWKFKVIDTHGFKHAEVSAGGVNTQEIDPQTMMSKKTDGLYFSGEVIDIVGKRGGYNFAFAWASGHLAGNCMSQ